MPGSTFLLILKNNLLFVSMLVVGFVLAKRKLFEKDAVVTISNILVCIAMPALVLTKISEMDLRSVDLSSILISVILPIILEFAIFGIAQWLMPEKVDPKRRRPAQFCAIFSNCGFLGIPLANAVWPDRPEVVLYVSIFNCISTFQLLTLGKYVLSRDKKSMRFRGIISAPILWAIIIGVVFSLFKVKNQFPIIHSYANYFAQLTTPLSMIVLGYELSKIKFKKLIKTGCFYCSITIKLIASPIMALVLLILFRCIGLNITVELAFAIFVSTSVSTAASASSLSSLYKTDGEFAAGITVANTILSVITL